MPDTSVYARIVAGEPLELEGEAAQAFINTM
jgi:hypothetical protein